MGLTTFHAREASNQRDTKGKRSFTGQQAATARQYGNDASGEYGDSADMDQEQSLVEDPQISGQGRRSGFFNWVGGLFSEDIIFWFHETQIKGKDGRQVKGGAAQLFKGVVLDLTQASMTGEADGKRQSVRLMEGGTPAKLVVNPARRGDVSEYDVTDFVITAPKKGKADGFSAEIREQLTFQLGAGVLLHAKGAAICDEMIVLADPSLTGVQGDGVIRDAVINEGGIQITTKEVPEHADIEKSAQELLGQKPAEGQSTEVPETSQIPEVKETAPESKPSEETASGSTPPEGQASEETASGSKPSEGQASEETASGSPSSEKPAIREVSSESGTPEAEKESGGKDSDEKGDGDDDDGDDDDDDDDDGLQVDLETLSVSYASDGNKIALHGKERSVDFQKDDLEGNVNFGKKTFKIAWGKDLSSEEDDEDEGDETEGEKEETQNVVEAVKESYEEIKGNGMELLDKAGFAKDSLVTFLRTGQLPENKFDKGGEEVSAEVPLVQIPIVPGVTFKTTLEPSWSFGVHFEFGAEEGGSEEEPEAEAKTQDGKVTEISQPEIKRNLYLTTELKGSIGATLKLLLEAGVGYLFSVTGGLTATGKAHGTLDRSEDLFGRGRFQIPVTMKGNEIKTGNAELELDAGIGLMGSVGAELSAGSTIFDWEKELWSYTFKEWNPLDLQGKLKLKQNGKKGLFNPGGWDIDEKAFSFELFQKKIEGSEKYGIKMYKLSENAEALIAQGGTTAERIGRLHDRLDAIRQQIGGDGGQFGEEGSQAYQTLIDEMKGIISCLKYVEERGEITFDALDKEIDATEKNKTYQASREKAKKKLEKHNDRYEKMKEWGEQFEGSENERSDQAYSYYKETFHAKKAVKQQDEAREEAARKKLATKQNLIAYEEKRIRELGAGFDREINLLKEDMTGMEEEEKGKANPAFLESYKTRKYIKGEKLPGNWQRYAGKKRILEYEEKRRDKYKERHTERYTELVKKAEELNISDRKVPNRKFVEYYYNDLKARRFFSKEELLQHHHNGAKIVAYEEARLKEKASGYMDRVEMLAGYKKEYDGAEDQEKKDEILAMAKRYYEAAGGKLGNKRQWNTNVARAASKEEILSYETKKADMNENSNVPQEFLIAKKALEILKTKGVKGFGPKSVTIQSVSHICHQWMSRNLKDNDELLEEVVPVKVLYNFEQDRRNELKNWERAANVFKRGENKQIAVDNKLAENPEYQERGRRMIFLESLMKDSDTGKEGAGESAIQDTKKSYFSDYFKGKEGEKDKKKLIFLLTKGESLYTPELFRVVLERKLEEFGGSHKERVKKLREMMAPGEGGEKSSVTDAQVWEEYRDMGAGRGFADYYAKEKAGKFTIDDMLRYEQNEAREHSAKNAFKAFLQNSIEKKVKKDGEEEVKKKEELARGGHYDRYNTLKEMQEGGASDEEITKKYMELGGGDGYVKFLMEDDLYLELVTPQEILDYEQNCSGKKGQKHDDRMEKLKELSETLSDEEFYDKYREMVLKESDSKELLDHITGVKTGFDASLNEEEVLTPKVLLRIEEQSRAEALKKHTDRLEMLKSDEVTDENALEKYRGAGGGKGFLDEKSMALWQVQNQQGSSADLQNILDYEKGRRENYEKALAELEKPLERLKKEQKQLREKLKQAKIDMDHVEELLKKHTEHTAPAYQTRESFAELVDVTTGAESQKNAESGVARTEEVMKTVTEEKMPELEQLQATQLQAIQLEMMLMEEEDSSIGGKLA